MSEIWRGSAELFGSGIIVSNSYPFNFLYKNVSLEIFEPIDSPGPFDKKIFKQKIEFELMAEGSDAEDLALEALLGLTDMVSFATSRRVEFSLGYLSGPPVTKEGQPRTILMMKRIPIIHDTIQLPLQYLNITQVI